MKGKQGRCYEFWRNYEACTARAPNPKSRTVNCSPIFQDYNECLHHKKEYARIRAIEAERVKRVAAGETTGVGDGSPATFWSKIFR